MHCGEDAVKADAGIIDQRIKSAVFGMQSEAECRYCLDVFQVKRFEKAVLRIAKGKFGKLRRRSSRYTDNGIPGFQKATAQSEPKATRHSGHEGKTSCRLMHWMISLLCRPARSRSSQRREEVLEPAIAQAHGGTLQGLSDVR